MVGVKGLNCCRSVPDSGIICTRGKGRGGCEIRNLFRASFHRRQDRQPMTDLTDNNLGFLFHPRSVAVAGISLAHPEHWTRTFYDGMVEFFDGPVYPVNIKGGEISGRKVYPRLRDIQGAIDYVISTVPAAAAPQLVEECAEKGVRAIHFCTAGFSETGEAEGKRLEDELVSVARTQVQTSR